MRNSKEGAAKNRQRIVASAARMFRARGIASVGIGELMQKAAMTHGGFYKHFASKDALVAEACAFALAQSGAHLRRAAECARAGEELKAIVDAYLSESHRDNPGGGCALATLGAELGNRKSPARYALAQGRKALVGLVARYWKGPDPKGNASAIVSMMVGAMINARIAGEQADTVLRSARQTLYRRIAGPARRH